MKRLLLDILNTVQNVGIVGFVSGSNVGPIFFVFRTLMADLEHYIVGL